MYICMYVYVSVYSKEDTIIRTIKHTHTLEFPKDSWGHLQVLYGIPSMVFFGGFILQFVGHCWLVLLVVMVVVDMLYVLLVVIILRSIIIKYLIRLSVSDCNNNN